ncbi:MAG: LLM class F420-dependent oxidoreductase [Acidimicrobiales bacterium]
MKLSVTVPSVAAQEGPGALADFGRAVEEIGYDDLSVYDHVVMGYPTDTRPGPMYPPQMPIIEALILLGHLAAVTERVTLTTEVLVLPQRQPVLVAKQVSTIDTLSGGRVRLGVGVGWQESEYEALDERFDDRGVRMDEAIAALRTCWTEDRITLPGPHYTADTVAMEPKPPQGSVPLWVGGGSPRALRRVGELGDGWVGTPADDPAVMVGMVETIRRHAEKAGRDPDALGMQMMLQPPPRKKEDKAYYADHDRVVARAESLAGLGFGWVSLNATAVYQAGARSSAEMLDQLQILHDRIRSVVA